MLLLRREHIYRFFSMIMEKRQFETPFEKDDYDAGMNFLGVLGEVPVHELGSRTMTLCFEWLGEVSHPREINDYKELNSNILYDFNGSGDHYHNVDPRYLLPIGSDGLILKHVIIDDENELLRIWCVRRAIGYSRYKLMIKIPFVRQYLLSLAWGEIHKINQMCREKSITIKIVHVPSDL